MRFLTEIFRGIATAALPNGRTATEEVAHQVAIGDAPQLASEREARLERKRKNIQPY